MLFTVQQIPSGTFYAGVPIPEDWPQWLKNISVAAETVAYKDEIFTYAVAKRDFSEQAKELPGFAAYIQDYTLVSEDVPADFRPYFALHEIIEMNELAGKECRCVNALMIELRQVPMSIYHSYREYRCNFFERLIAFHQNLGTDSEELEEMMKSWWFLRIF